MTYIHPILTIMKKLIFPAAFLAAITVSSCSQELFNVPWQEETDSSGRIQLAGEINQVATTRVNDDGFADGDVMGVYIVDYEGTQPGTLLTKGNRGDNVRRTFDEAPHRCTRHMPKCEKKCKKSG